MFISNGYAYDYTYTFMRPMSYVGQRDDSSLDDHDASNSQHLDGDSFSECLCTGNPFNDKLRNRHPKNGDPLMKIESFELVG